MKIWGTITVILLVLGLIGFAIALGVYVWVPYSVFLAQQIAYTALIPFVPGIISGGLMIINWMLEDDLYY